MSCWSRSDDWLWLVPARRGLEHGFQSSETHWRSAVAQIPAWMTAIELTTHTVSHRIIVWTQAGGRLLASFRLVFLRAHPDLSWVGGKRALPQWRNR